MSKKRATKDGEISDNGLNTLPPLPKGWRWTKVHEVGEVKLGRQRSPEHHQGKHMRPYLRVANVYEDRIDLTDVMQMNFTPEEYETYKLQYGDILLNEGQSLEWVGRPAMYRDDLPGVCFQNTLVRFRPGPHLLPSFALLIFRYYLHSQRFQKIAKWTVNIAHLGASRFTELEFPLPPKSEQARIVEKFDELFTKLDAGIVSLKRAKATLKRYRATVLKAAVVGKLTQEWRKKRPSAEPVSVLLGRITTERRRRWEEEEVARSLKKEQQFPKGWQLKYQDPEVPEASGLPLLPEGWCWTTLDAISLIVGGITKDQKRTRTATMREVPYLRVANVQRGHFDLREMKLILADEEEIEALRLIKDDILFTEGGDRDKLGRGWVWNDEIEECIHQNHIFRARLFFPFVESKFISYHGNSFGQEWFSRTGKQTTNLASINKTILRRFPIPLAPHEEQKQIIAEAEQRLTIVDKIEAQVEANLKRAARLRQSLFKRAFEGRLVPQDFKDEPSERLLERNRTEPQISESEKDGIPKAHQKSKSWGVGDMPLFEKDGGFHDQ